MQKTISLGKKVVYPRNFREFLKWKEYSLWDFIEPVLAFPIIFIVIKFFQGVNLGIMILAIIIFGIYLPLAFMLVKRRRR